MVAKRGEKIDFGARKFCGTSGCGSSRTQKSMGALRCAKVANHLTVIVSRCGRLLANLGLCRAGEHVGEKKRRNQTRLPSWKRRAAPEGPTLLGKPMDGRHLGCGGSHFLSRGNAWGGPLGESRASGVCRADSWRSLFGGSSRRRFSIPVPERVCDRRCLSRSGWGNAFIAITTAQAAVVGAERAGIWIETQSLALARDLSAG